MKKKILLLVGGLSMFISSNAQQISDALNYGQDEILGTARFRALSGAFGALGGDMSAVSINPAGSAVFSVSHVSATTSILNSNTDTNFFDGNSSGTNTEFDINQAGIALVFNNREENSPWKKFTLGFAFDKTANYNNDWYAHGTNPNNSIVNYFMNYAQGKRLDEISAFQGESYNDAYADIGYYYGYGNQQAFLGYEGYLIDPDPTDPNYVSDPDAVTSYVPNIVGNNFNQNYSFASRGYNGKVVVNFGTQFTDNLFLGLNLNSHFIDYKRSTYFIETNSNVGSSVSRVEFGNDLSTLGYGFSFQLGAIYKIQGLRLGATYNSPTWYSIDEETTQYLFSQSSNAGSTEINPYVVNIFPRYRIQNPGKVTGSIAYVFGERGLLSFDYSYKDYSNTRFKPSNDPDFSYLNGQMGSVLTGASTYRIGGEFKIKQLSFRAGYREEESPYNNKSTIGELKGYSLGLGLSLGKVKLDLTYDNSQRKYNYQFFETGLTDPILLDTNNHNITFTASFNL